MKLKPMSTDEIKENVERCCACQYDDCFSCAQTLRVILAWAEAEARARYHSDPSADHHDGLYATRIAPYIEEVLIEIDWPED